MVMLVYCCLILQNIAESNCPNRVYGHNPPNKMTCQHNLMRSSSYGEAIFNSKKLESRSSNICQVFSLQVPDSKLNISNVGL